MRTTLCLLDFWEKLKICQVWQVQLSPEPCISSSLSLAQDTRQKYCHDRLCFYLTLIGLARSWFVVWTLPRLLPTSMVPSELKSLSHLSWFLQCYSSLVSMVFFFFSSILFETPPRQSELSTQSEAAGFSLALQRWHSMLSSDWKTRSRLGVFGFSHRGLQMHWYC